jgi:bacterioferritin-associated ferredoxin
LVRVALVVQPSSAQLEVIRVYACICSAVTEDQVRTAIDAGARTVEDIGDMTCAGTGCGNCHEELQDLLAQKCGSCPRARLAVVA